MSSPLRPGLTLPATVRLGLFQGCLGCLAVIFSGLLNRIMLSELGFPGLLVGGALAFEQFVAPSRVLFGQISDAHPLASRHRVPYVLLGTAAFCLMAVLSVPLIFRVGRLLEDGSQPGLAFGIAALCGLFALYGLAVSLATTPYLALVIDRTSEQERPRAVSIIWCMLTVGIVIGAVAIGVSLRSLDGVNDPVVLEATLSQFMASVAGVVMLLTVVATWGMESPLRERTDGTAVRREDAIGLRQSWTLITSSRQVLIFFSFLILFTLALFLQDPVLESYGAQVFAMPIAATAQLNAFWGVGTLVGLLVAGLWVVPRLGKMATARLGCQLIALSLLLLLVAGLTARIPFLQAVMVLFGLAAGIGTNSALCLMLDLTLPQAAGTFVGVWGLAQALSRAIGKLLGGGLYDIGRALPLGDGPYGPFALVLGVELLVALAALLLLGYVNVRQFREDTSHSLSQVLEMEMG
ncbi:BCD family MFS transporter [Cyanobium gracile]|uniref:PUCC protein n=1 Tax=Cyanobium gracile (strain ATCC 27147 / PCC 6307) TaxID=292564 RepID=K9PAA6_CYAGP|nr:BCD family MFS transporter [Cyanobium gracile]AFY30060.1 PUCC protein [Cyanobium gracile PCC 6307]